jgi:hypothetical protein
VGDAPISQSNHPKVISTNNVFKAPTPDVKNQSQEEAQIEQMR